MHVSLCVCVCVCVCVYYSCIELGTHNSSLEGATELKFAPFCSS